MTRYIILLVLATGSLSGCSPVSDNERQIAQERRSDAVRQSANTAVMAGLIAGAQASVLLGNEQATRQYTEAARRDMLRSMRLPDATRPIAREPALAAIRKIEGVVSTAWVDHGNLWVRVDNGSYRTMRTIDRVCSALTPLVDTLAVVVHVQDAHAKTSEASESILRNCRLPPGEYAVTQRRRRIDAVDPAIRRVFKAQQSATRDEQPEP